MIRTETTDGIRTLVLANGKAHALDGPLLIALTAALEDAAQTAPRGLVLTAEGSIFCAGIDLVALHGSERAKVQELLDALYDACRALFAYPHPVVAALNGHAIAGGALLSLACDHRVMAEGAGKWGLSESALGLSIPAYGIEIVRYALPRPVAEKLMYSGSVYPAYKAHDMGALDQLVDPQQLAPRAMEWITNVTSSLPAFADLKSKLRGPTLAAMEHARAQDGDWLALWFSEPTQAKLAAARDRLTSKGAGRS
jgi:enoyl-CoA hydratase